MKKSLPILLLFSLLLIAGCRDTNNMENISSTINQRTFTVTASMPENNTSSTRLVASQETDSKNIELKWKKDDKIQLYFEISENNFVRTETTIKNISANGKNAEFDVVVPDEVTGNFDLYGVHGAESVISEGTILLDARPTPLEKLGEITIPIYFKKENISLNFKATNVTFNHYGTLQVLTFKNKVNSKVTLNGQEILSSDGKWYYDTEDHYLPVYDIITGTVFMKEVGFPSVSSSSTATIDYSDNEQFAQWIVPNGTPPAVYLQMNIDGEEKSSVTSKAPLSEPLKVGNAYHLYSAWDGVTLDFTNEAAVQTHKITMTTSIAVGDTIEFYMDAAAVDHADVWIDLNNNGHKESNEAITKIGKYNVQKFAIDSQAISIYGKIFSLTCMTNSITSLDISKNKALTILNAFGNDLTSLDITKNTALTELNCSNNELTTLDLSESSGLINLYCYLNSFESLDFSACTSLSTLICAYNKFTSLDLSKCTSLKSLDCNDNFYLTSLDVSSCTNLNKLNCYFCKLPSLDISNCTMLTRLHCYANQLKSLDITKNTALNELYCYKNRISGTEMDNLINNLPNLPESSKGKLRIINLKDNAEKNVCTTAQVTIANSKGWNVFDSTGATYLGSE